MHNWQEQINQGMIIFLFLLKFKKGINIAKIK